MWGFPGGSMVKNSPANAGDLGSADPLENEMATHYSTLVWRIPWTEEPGGLPSLGSQRVGHNSLTKQQKKFISFNAILLRLADQKGDHVAYLKKSHFQTLFPLTSKYSRNANTFISKLHLPDNLHIQKQHKTFSLDNIAHI